LFRASERANRDDSSGAEEALAHASALMKRVSTNALVRHSLSTQGHIHWRRGHYAQAEVAIRELLEQKSREFGPRSSEVSVNLVNLGMLLSETGKYPEAESLMRSALQIRESTLGAMHPATANALVQLSHILIRRGHGDEALALMQRALSIRLETYGPV